MQLVAMPEKYIFRFDFNWFHCVWLCLFIILIFSYKVGRRSIDRAARAPEQKSNQPSGHQMSWQKAYFCPKIAKTT